MKVIIMLLGLGFSLSQTALAFGDMKPHSSELTHINADVNQFEDVSFVDMTIEYWGFQNELVQVHSDNLVFADLAEGDTCKITLKRIRILWSLICIGEIEIEVPCDEMGVL